MHSEPHLAERVGILAEALGPEATLAKLADRLGAVPVELEALVRERGGRHQHVVAEPRTPR